MKNNIFYAVCVLLVSAMLSSCWETTLPVAPDSANVPQEGYVYPESDNGYSWSYDSKVKVDTTVYTVTMEVTDDIVNHTEVNASGGGYGSYSYIRVWQDGKGILTGKYISITPFPDTISVPEYIIIKTSDLKAMGIPNGAEATFICNMDTEVLSPVMNNQVMTTAHLSYELDNCRMKDFTITVPETITPTLLPSQTPIP